MYIILLSGGAGKRLWPLSNELYSKQYIKVVNEDNLENEKSVSMLQRVYGQLNNLELAEKLIITASEAQTELIKGQLNEEIKIAIEPERRDTFPAIMLSCAYLFSEEDIPLDEYVAVLPVDSYVNKEFFLSLKKAENILKNNNAELALLGVDPTYPSEKYGYILPREKFCNGYSVIEKFKEKPTIEQACSLIETGGLWNCGVFCFQLNNAKTYLQDLDLPFNYQFLFNNYTMLPKISFDFMILEKCKNAIVVRYDGMWKDIGTWNTLTEEMRSKTMGYVVMDEKCKNTHVINMLDIPIVVKGIHHAIISATQDGILVSDKGCSSYLKESLELINELPRYEERRWGTIKVIEKSNDREAQSWTKKVKVIPGSNTSYHIHQFHDENIIVLSGGGDIIMNGKLRELIPGDTIKISMGVSHAIRAGSEGMKYMEICVGNLQQDDVVRLTMKWNDIAIDM